MNYFNPYFSTIPYSYTPAVTTSRGLLGGLFGEGRLSSIINGTQKTLGIVNQAIPIVKQLSPVMKNAKTMFKVMNEFKRVDKPNTVTHGVTKNNTKIELEPTKDTEVSKVQSNNNLGPTFFL